MTDPPSAHAPTCSIGAAAYPPGRSLQAVSTGVPSHPQAGFTTVTSQIWFVWTGTHLPAAAQASSTQNPHLVPGPHPAFVVQVFTGGPASSPTQSHVMQPLLFVA